MYHEQSLIFLIIRDQLMVINVENKKNGDGVHSASTEQCFQDDYELHCRFCGRDGACTVSTNLYYMVLAHVSFKATVRLKTR